jgi:hypothetical protein
MHVEKQLIFLQISLYTAADFNQNFNASMKFDKLLAITFQENLISVPWDVTQRHKTEQVYVGKENRHTIFLRMLVSGRPENVKNYFCFTSTEIAGDIYIYFCSQYFTGGMFSIHVCNHLMLLAVAIRYKNSIFRAARTLIRLITCVLCLS